MVRVIKTIKGNAYYYDQHSQRIAGKVVTKSVYVGAVNPKRSLRSKVRNILGQLAPGITDIAAHAVAGRLERKAYKDHQKPYDRSQRVLNDKLRALAPKFTVPVGITEDGRTRGRFPSKEAKELYVAEHGRLRAEWLDSKLSPTEKAAKEAHKEEVNAGARAWKEANQKWIEQQAKQEAAKAPEVAPPAQPDDTEEDAGAADSTSFNHCASEP